jgi:pimeloyl-ACP methyl ester carboxylesterase
MPPKVLPWTDQIVLLGSGPGRVVLLSGFGSSPETLRDLGRAIQERAGATVVLSGLPRHDGDESAFLQSRGWHYVREAERRFLRIWQAAQTPVHVGGYSTGALVALLLAARHPSKVAGVILVSPALRLAAGEKVLVAYTVGSTYYVGLPLAMLGSVAAVAWHARRGSWGRARALLSLAGSAAVIGAAALGLRTLTVPLPAGEPLERNGDEVLAPRFSRASIVGGSTLLPLQLVARWRLRRLSLPVCLVFGERDTVVDVRFGTLRAAANRLAELHVVPGAPHRVSTFPACHDIVSDFVLRTTPDAARPARRAADIDEAPLGDGG